MTFENILLKDRKALTPQESVRRLINYALQTSIFRYGCNLSPILELSFSQHNILHHLLDIEKLDARKRSRTGRHARVTWALPILLFTWPAFYIFQGAANGCWTDIHPVDRLTLTYATIGRPYRLIYRPEIFLRDQQANLIELETEHIQKSKLGEIIDSSSPLVLWN